MLSDKINHIIVDEEFIHFKGSQIKHTELMSFELTYVT